MLLRVDAFQFELLTVARTSDSDLLESRTFTPCPKQGQSRSRLLSVTSAVSRNPVRSSSSLSLLVRIEARNRQEQNTSWFLQLLATGVCLVSSAPLYLHYCNIPKDGTLPPISSESLCPRRKWHMTSGRFLSFQATTDRSVLCSGHDI